MNRQQAKELCTLITTVRHVKEMSKTNGISFVGEDAPGCLLCEGVRHGLYTIEDKGLDFADGFSSHFGCTKTEASAVLHPFDTKHPKTTGESYYQVGKELLMKYEAGREVLRNNEAMPFTELMESLNDPTKGNKFIDCETVTWEGKEVPVLGRV